MAKYYYVPKCLERAFVDMLARKQEEENRFANITVKPYKGKLFDPAETVTIKVG